MSTKKTTVLIIDDSAIIRQMLTSMLRNAPDIEVIGTANDPLEAREKIKQLNPDVITLDIEMPKMDGITFLDKIMKLRPMPVIMVSTLTQQGADVTLQALEMGAIDYISKPTAHRPGEGLESMQEELIEKIRIASQANIAKMPTQQLTPSNTPPTPLVNASQKNVHMVAIGSSTGGVEALSQLFLMLPEGMPPIVMAQHMLPQFTASLAKRLNALSPIEIVEATHGITLKSGYAYIAPGSQHLKIAKQGSSYITRLDDGEAVSGHKPSVDVLFESVAQATAGHSIGVILTGMGQDGAIGLKKMYDTGSYTIGQNESSCVVYGMPKAAMQAGAVSKEYALTQIASSIIEQLNN